MPSPPLFGLETEYAILGGATSPLAVRAIAAAPRLLQGVVTNDQVFWTVAGGKLYLDPTGFLEYATPEALHPADIVAAVFAGHEMAARLLASLPTSPKLLLHNVHPDESGGTSWAAHENYAIDRGKFMAVKQALLSHCATRVIFTGAGGFSMDSGFHRFTLSPRAHFLTCDVSPDTTALRGIVGARDENHAAQHERVHVIAGETLMSRLGVYLRVGTTALVLSLAQQGLVDCRPMAPEHVVTAMQGCALDLTARTHRYRSLTHGEVRAIDAQRFFLEHCDRHRQSLPDWAPEVMSAWDRVLTSIENDDPALAGRLDWAFRLKVVRQTAAAAGVTLDELAEWGKCLHRLEAAPVLELEGAASGAAPSAAEVRRMCRLHNKPVESLPRIRQVRTRLWAACVKASIWGDGGLWKELEGARALCDEAPGVDAARVMAACTTPPAGTRAVPRSRYIHAHLNQSGIIIDWSSIVESGPGRPTRVARMPDPYCIADPTWSEGARAGHERGRDRQLVAYRLFQQGRFAATIESCRTALNQERHAGTSWELNFHRYWSWAAARMGNTAEAMSAQARAERSAGADPSTTHDDRLVCGRWLGFANDQYATAAEACIAWHQQRPLSGVGSEYVGVLRLRQNRLEEARRHLQRAIDNAEQPRLRARASTSLAEVCRREGQAESALGLLADAERVQREGFLADLVETLVVRAKVRRQDGQWLSEAMAILQTLNHVPGIVYATLVSARGRASANQAMQLRQRIANHVDGVPALRACPLCCLILGTGWDEWTRGQSIIAGDDFWGLHQ